MSVTALRPHTPPICWLQSRPRGRLSHSTQLEVGTARPPPLPCDCLTQLVLIATSSGGNQAEQIMYAMEQAALSSGATIGPYGSAVHKQLYIYGGLDRGPTVLNRSFGLAWGIGGWLLGNYLQRVGAGAAAMWERVACELSTTFASSYKRQISLAECLEPAVISEFAKQATGEKFLVVPTRAHY